MAGWREEVGSSGIHMDGRKEVVDGVLLNGFLMFQTRIERKGKERLR